MTELEQFADFDPLTGVDLGYRCQWPEHDMLAAETDTHHLVVHIIEQGVVDPRVYNEVDDADEWSPH